MGYTHYFKKLNQLDSINEEAVEIIKALVKEGVDKNVLCFDYNTPDKEPAVTSELIRFNGKGEDGHETFVICPKTAQDFEFCKTAYKPYDVYVTKVLLVLMHFHPEIEVSSDGDMDGEDWKEAQEWAEEKLEGYKAPEFDHEPTEEDLEEIARLIENGNTSGTLGGEGYTIGWSIEINKFQS